jgi:hypothetical protein
LKKRIIEKVAVKQLTPTNLQGFRSVLEHAEQYERQIMATIVDSDDPIQAAYDRFEMLDAQLFPMEMLAGLQEKDIIETIRMSPHDADKGFSCRSYADKVSGDGLYHFAGFFKRSWRSNDILWGRLDGLCQLVETLLQSDRIKDLGKMEETRPRMDDRLHVINALDPAALFPHAGKKTQDSLRAWLYDLFSKEPEKRREALDQKAFAAKLELLIEAAQLEVIAEELPNVLTDALTEQATWNQFRVQTKEVASGDSAPIYDAVRWSFKSASGRLDPLVAMTAAAEMTRAAVAPYAIPGEIAPRPSHTALGKFFKDSYRVGTERLTRDIPALVLLEIVAVALLVIRNCVLALFPDGASRIKWNPLYLGLVAAPLHTFHAMVVLWRRAPGWGLGVMLGLAVLCLFALGVGFFWPNKLTTRTLSIFFIGPVMILVLESIIWVMAARWLKWRERRHQGT